MAWAKTSVVISREIGLTVSRLTESHYTNTRKMRFPAHLKGLCLHVRCRAPAEGVEGTQQTSSLQGWPEMSLRDWPQCGVHSASTLLGLHLDPSGAGRLQAGLSICLVLEQIPAWPVEQSKSLPNSPVPWAMRSCVIWVLYLSQLTCTWSFSGLCSLCVRWRWQHVYTLAELGEQTCDGDTRALLLPLFLKSLLPQMH